MEVLVPASPDVGAVSLNGRYIDVHLSYGDVHESQQQSLVIDLATSTIRWVPMTQQVVFDHGVAIGIRHLPPGSDVFSEVVAVEVASGDLHAILRSQLPFPLALQGNFVGGGRDFVALSISGDWNVHFVSAQTLELIGVIEIPRGMSATPTFEGAIRGTHDGRLLIRRETSVDLYRDVGALDGAPERSWDAGEVITHWSVSVNDDQFALTTERAAPEDSLVPGELALLVGRLDHPELHVVESPLAMHPLVTRDELFVNTSQAWYRRQHPQWQRLSLGRDRVVVLRACEDGRYFVQGQDSDTLWQMNLDGPEPKFEEVARFIRVDR